MYGTLLAEKLTNAEETKSMPQVPVFKTGAGKTLNQFVFDGSF
jgi:hypothetical protein